MSHAIGKNDHSLRPHLPKRFETADTGKSTAGPSPMRRGGGMPEVDSPTDFQEHDLLADSTDCELLDDDPLPEETQQEDLMDEAADIEVHPDEMNSFRRFFDTPQDACEQARKALHQSPYRELRVLNVRAAHDRLEILGQTSSFFLKQMAQEIIRKAIPELTVDNLIGVRHHH